MKGFHSVTEQDLLRWVESLVSHPSQQSQAMERDPAVQSLATLCVAPILSRFGLRARYDEFGNLLVEAGTPDTAITLAFFCYAMTHPQSQMKNAFECTSLHIGGVHHLRGRGISEQKAPLAAALAAFTDFVASGAPRRRVAWVLLTAGETGRHDAIVSALAALKQTPRYSILAVGSALRVDAGHRGRLDIEITVAGRACHSSTPWLGVDVTHGVRIILERAQRLGAHLPNDPDLGSAQLTCTSIHTGPPATHTVQSEARLTFDRRLLPAERVDEVFEALAREWRLEPPLETTIQKGPFMHPHRLPRDSRLLTNVRTALGDAGLALPEIGFAQGALDCGLLQHRGGEALMWGPGDPAQFHTADEWVAVPDIVSMAECYRAILQSTAIEGRWA